MREAITGALAVEEILSRRDEVIHALDDSSMTPWLEERNVTIVRGDARLTGERVVEVDGEVLVARRAVVLAVGTRGAHPADPGPQGGSPVDESRGDDVAGSPADDSSSWAEA